MTSELIAGCRFVPSRPTGSQFVCERACGKTRPFPALFGRISSVLQLFTSVKVHFITAEHSTHDYLPWANSQASRSKKYVCITARCVRRDIPRRQLDAGSSCSVTPEPHGEGHNDTETPRRKDGNSQAGGETYGASPGKGADGRVDVDVILQKLAEWRDEAATQREADWTETGQALMVQEKAKGVVRWDSLKPGAATFARPARQGPSLFGTRVTADIFQNAADPIAKLREDGATAAEPQAILVASGVSLSDIEGININSDFYRTLNDTKLFDVPWPSDTVYRSNGKKALYDTMSIPEFVVGYCNIVIASLPVNNDTEVAADHVRYLADVTLDVDGGDWELVRNSHRQVLHLIEQRQLKWEDKNARDIFRGKYLQRAERAAGMGKSLKVQGSSDGGKCNATGSKVWPFSN